MPRPFTAPAAKAVNQNTHTATLVNGKSYTLVTASRLGNPLKFEEGVPKDVTKEVMEVLKAKAKDNVTTTTGSKTSGKLQPKFTFKPLKGVKIETSADEEEEEEETEKEES